MADHACDDQIHFNFSGTAGISLGNAIALETLQLFDAYWDQV
jgi:hypothetical protein